jgi:NAD(P)-dependent dehydrogenase (short-subunit alcohol dehydrogenase family)
MSKTILITGASTGIGKATAHLFHKRGWNVAATMRLPENDASPPKDSTFVRLKLDVLDHNSIASAVSETVARFGGVDAVVNNAGYGLVGPFEASQPDQVKRQYDTNVFGLMNVIREILPHFRQRKAGTIINVASVGGRVAFPLYSLYHGTKWAVEGFSESLQYELRPHNIRVKIIEPGPIKTDFYDRSQDLMKKPGLSAYDEFVNRAMPNLQSAGANAPSPELVAQVIYRAATDGSWKLRYTANSLPLLVLRRILPDAIFRTVVRSVVLR